MKTAAIMLTLFSSLSNAAVVHGQQLQWVKQLGTAESNISLGVSADGLGNVYFTGSTKGDLGSPNAGGQDAFVGKYNTNGDLEWITLLGTSADDRSYGVSADGLGNVYISGYTEGDLGGQNAGSQDAFVSKFDSSGALQWTEQLGSTRRDGSRSLSADGLGNIYVSGLTYGTLAGTRAGSVDAFLSKFDASGSLQWTQQFGTDEIDSNGGVSADGLGFVYVAGHTYGSLVGQNAGDADIYLGKYDAGGSQVWKRQLGTDAQDIAKAVAADEWGNVYVAGWTYGDLTASNGGYSDGFLSQYDSNGSLQWTRLLGEDSYDEIEGVSVDERGNIFVAGRTRGTLGEDSAGSYDIIVGKYDPTGALQWLHQLGVPELDGALDISTDGLGSVYVSGYTEGSQARSRLGFDDIIVAKFSVTPEPTTMALFCLGTGHRRSHG